MSLSDSFAAFGIGFRNLFRPKVTAPLPWKERRPRAERYRATFALVHDAHGDEACIGCKMCEKICPSQIIVVTGGPKAESPNTGKKRGWCADFTLDLNACIACELCVQVCPADAIVMLRVQEQPGFDRNELLLTMEKLYANEKLAEASWADGSKLIAMQEPGGATAAGGAGEGGA
ncbi:NADH-quinone oxidoreductase subunit I [Myxococcota bacterium]|nr:NADH-quinone oxidoreductase subunit I [Myxococcota bacterium]